MFTPTSSPGRPGMVADALASAAGFADAGGRAAWRGGDVTFVRGADPGFCERCRGSIGEHDRQTMACPDGAPSGARPSPARRTAEPAHPGPAWPRRRVWRIVEEDRGRIVRAHEATPTHPSRGLTGGVVAPASRPPESRDATRRQRNGNIQTH